MLGREVVRVAAERGWKCLAWDREAFDLTRETEVVRAIASSHADVVLHTAAYTDVDGCEKNPGLAYAVNGRGTAFVARGCREAGARLVAVSTDYVFDGTKPEPYAEEDAPGPVSCYGWSKLLGEEAVLALGNHGVLARTAWVYADHGKNFYLTMLRIAAKETKLRVVDDQKGSPTFAGDLAVGLCHLAEAAHRGRAAGIYHVTHRGAATWNAFARKIFEVTGKPMVVEACTSAEFPRPAKRPANSVLASVRLEQAGVPSLPSWEEGLQTCVARGIPDPPDGTPRS